MKLSIVIVNYNVEHFLHQCLRSVYRAIGEMDAEVWVVDNHSADGSVEMVRKAYPDVKLIANHDNPGYAKANNQAMRQSLGEYILLLNPDTILSEENLSKSISIMDSNPQVGSMGCRMIDGTGEYLPESKRGLPTPWVAFYKIFGLANIFPRSSKYARYYLGHLSDRENQIVDVHCGAWMLMRKEALDKAGLLDETFFMYGEDIDLSYRIQKAGYENRYFAEAPIIHYKGESTKKGSLNYVYVFYQAMIIFAKKHFTKDYARAFSFLIRLGIYFRASMSIVKRLIKTLAMPLLDFGVIYAGLLYLTYYWEHNHRFIEGGHYPDLYKELFLPLYAWLWIASLRMTGAYRIPIRINRIFAGIALGSILILVGYSLSPEELRFSRAIIILGTAWTFAGVILVRAGLNWFPGFGRKLFKNPQRRIALIDVKDRRAELRKMMESDQLIHHIEWMDIGDIQRKSELFDLQEIVFAADSYSYTEIIRQMDLMHAAHLKFRIAYFDMGWVIGSDSIHDNGQVEGSSRWSILRPDAVRKKRLLDVIIGLISILFAPIGLLNKGMRQITAHSFQLILGKKTLVGYYPDVSSKAPAMKASILSCGPDSEEITDEEKIALNELYARHWEADLDVRAFFRFLKKGTWRS